MVRIGPVVPALAKVAYIVSVDTRKAEIMRRAVDSGARMINECRRSLTIP